MNDRWPVEIDELLAAYALDAVDDDERTLVEEYLRENPRALAEVESYREVLAYLDPGSTAPAGVWERIASELDATPPPLRLDAFRPPPRRQARGRLLAVAAAIVAVAIAGGVIAQQARDDGDTESVAAAIEREARDASRDPQTRTVLLRDERGTLSVAAYAEPDGDLFVAAAPLPTLSADRTYQLWCVRDDAPVSLAVMGPRPTTSKLHVDSCDGALAITDERAGGVAQPSGDPVVAGRVA